MKTGTGKARALVKAAPLIVLDVVATVLALTAALWGTGLPVEKLLFYAAILSVVNVAVYTVMHMYTTLWQYASVGELVRVTQAAFAAALLDALVCWVLPGITPTPLDMLMGFLVLLAVSGAARFSVRLLSGRGWSILGVTDRAKGPRSLVVGAGETGSLTVSRMLAGNPDMPGVPVAVVDDDPAKQGGYVQGYKVVGTCDDIPRLARELSVEQLVVAAPSATKAQRDRIFGLCMQTGLKTLTLPNVKDMPQDALGRVALRDVEISDLLAREEKALDMSIMGYVTGKRVLVTGGGGSIGSELVRQLLPARPAQIVLFDIYENTTYELYHEIRAKAADLGVDLRVEIGSITHLPALQKAFDACDPQVVFHAAAHKHVPLMEACVREAIENNVFGTLNTVRLAHERGCTHFVLVSTDKAVNPVNVMGATKRMCEIVVQYYASISKTVFTAVRFGNVLGSHGSVIPLFKRQMREGGPITVTHKDITRYFMTIPEASRLVITAGALAKGGEIFVLDMGEPVRIWDLAENLVRLSGLKPGRDIEIIETGLRPGEKMYEELLMETETLLPTANKDIRISTGDVPDLGTVSAKLDMLEVALNKDNDAIKRALAEAVPTYHPQFQD